MQSHIYEDEVPQPGQTIRTKKMSMEGKVERIGQNSAGYPEVFFRIADGRLMKTPLENVVVVEKLADEEIEMEGSMGGINRCAPAQDVSYEHVLDDVYESWNQEKKNALSDNARKYFGEPSRPIAHEPAQRPIVKVQETKQTRKVAPKAKSVVESVSGMSFTAMLDSAAAGNTSLMAPIVRKSTVAENKEVDYQAKLDEMLGDKNKNQEDDVDVAAKLGIRRSDIDTLRSLLDGKIAFGDLPLEFRNKIYKMYPGLPMGHDGKLTREFAELLSKKLGISGRDEMTQDMFGYDDVKDVDEAITPWGGYTKDDKKANALAKAPKSSMQGTKGNTFSQMVQDTINKHGVKWAFQYYVIKHGLPPRHFRIYAGI